MKRIEKLAQLEIPGSALVARWEEWANSKYPVTYKDKSSGIEYPDEWYAQTVECFNPQTEIANDAEIMCRYFVIFACDTPGRHLTAAGDDEDNIDSTPGISSHANGERRRCAIEFTDKNGIYHVNEWLD
jgi:hypothetical protein